MTMSNPSFTRDEILELWEHLTPDEQAEIMSLFDQMPIWTPIAGVQTQAYLSKATITGYGGAAGGGKGLALDTLLATPTGFTTMADVVVGDTLLDETGNPCQVIGVSEISQRPCFELVFDDGTTVIADDVHRWVTFDAKELEALTRRTPEFREKRRLNRESTAKATTSQAKLEQLKAHNASIAKALPLPTGTMRDTQTLFDTLLTGRGRRNHAIKVANALNLDEADLIVPPYTLGAWLGDGASRNGQITSVDDEVCQAIEQDGFDVVHYEWDAKQHNVLGLKVKLREIGVLENKHIPMQYKRASFEQRLALLQGLMDTDGHCALDGGCEYDGVNETLVGDVYELVMSLGIKATLQTGKAKLNGKVISDKYRVKFTTSLPVFNLPRKLQRLKSGIRRTGKFRYLVSCEPVESVPTKCIAVDSPSRQYLITKAMLPTHNTDLAVGLALTEHQRVMIVRDEAKQLKGITDRIIEIVGHRKGFNSVGGSWTNPVPNCLIDLLGIPNIGDETKMQGVPHDLIVFDETANLRESQVRFLMGWLRSADPKQRKRVLMTFNPPTTAEGRWVIDYFKPWLDKNYEPKAKSGELRACYVVEGKDYWLPTLNTDPFVLVDGEPCYDFDPCEYTAQDIIEPETRTFIHAKVTDNPYLVESGYIKTLQALPEPLRSQMLHGDFGAGVKDSEWQVIPTLWVEAAQARWKDRATMRQMGLLGEMDSLGVDPVRGGDDNLVIAKRYRNWIDELYVEKGTGVPDGTAVAARVVMEQKDQAPIHIDVIGVGASPYDKLKDIGVHVVGVDVRNASTETSSDGIMRFYNLRSQLWWQMREMLDPESGLDIALPPDTELLKDLTAPLWSFKGKEIQIEVKELTKKRIGRSPDRADAVILAMMNTQKRAKRKARNNRNVL